MITMSQYLITLTIISVTISNVCLATPTYLYHECSNTTTFSPNSTYQSDLTSLLASLSSIAAHESHNASSAGGAHALFFCRGDVNADVCHDCMAIAATDVLARCPFRREAVLWYDECQLHYSDSLFFGRVLQNPNYALLSLTEIGEDRGRFDRLVAATMREAAELAVDGKMFGVKIAEINDFQKLYGLAQCSPDLSELDCRRCLELAVSALPSCCGGKQGGRFSTPSCNVRYEVYLFFNQTAAMSQLPTLTSNSTKGKSNNLPPKIIMGIIAPIIAFVLLFILGVWLLRRKNVKNNIATEQKNDHNNEDEMTSTVQSLEFDLATLEAATNGFSDDCKLGSGGFGQVYKGTLSSGQEIAVKRLSTSSGQGMVEFKNEVESLAKLQHRNLVRLLGFCYTVEEKLLVYAYVPNKSLDCFLFDTEKQAELNWETRYKIIGGVARGILYLHEDSSIRIIHRDLKASNILLDGGMNPKISDFGMARIFVVDQTRGTTSRVVGTYGYMSPEYAMRGEYSSKSDVYSFGVLVLEIISGKNNTSFNPSNGSRDLLSYAWILWKEGTPMKFVDPTTRKIDQQWPRSPLCLIVILSQSLYLRSPGFSKDQGLSFRAEELLKFDESSFPSSMV